MRSVPVLIALVVLAGCRGQQLRSTDFIGQYEGNWARDDQGVLDVRRDGTYTWTPSGSTTSRPRHGTFEVHSTDGEWRITLTDLSNENGPRVSNYPFVVAFGRVRTLVIDPDAAAVLSRR